MIDRERFNNLSVQALKVVAECADALDCYDLDCDKCPFQLENLVSERFECALAYGKALYKRCTK